MQTKRFGLGCAVYAAVVCVAFGLAGQAIGATVFVPTVGCTADVYLSDQVWEDGGEEGEGSYDVRAESDFRSGLLGAATPAIALTDYYYPEQVAIQGLAASSSGIGVNPTVSAQTSLEAQGLGLFLLDSYARATNVLAWTPTSETRDDEDNIWVEFTIGLEGSLESFGNNAPTAKAGFDLNVAAYSLGGTPLSSLGGEATIEDRRWDWDVEQVVFEATGDLADSFTVEGNLATIDDEFKLRFQGQIGETYLIEIIMESSLYEAELLESWASSKFGNTLTYEFTAAYDVADTNFTTPLDDVAMVAVPEPATLGLLALGGLALIRRRRTA